MHKDRTKKKGFQVGPRLAKEAYKGHGTPASATSDVSVTAHIHR